MKPSQILGTMAAILSLASPAALAQTSATPATNASLRGTRAAELGFGYMNVNNTRLDGYATTLSANLPVAAGFDLGASVNYGWVEAHSSVDTTVAGIDATYFTELSSNSRGFATLSVGYAWLDWPFDDEWVWGARVGAEFDVNAQFTAIASVGYDATFDHGSDGVFDGSLRLNYRASDKLLPYIEVSAIEGGDWGAALGVAYKF